MNEISISSSSIRTRELQDLPDDRHGFPACRPQNISDAERSLSTFGGSALLVVGLSRGKLSGLLVSLCGAALLYRGLTGHCHGYEALGIDTASHPSATPSDSPGATATTRRRLIQPI